jgi:origin recognition complex subunit 5
MIELTSIRLLTRTSAVDPLDGPLTFRAAVRCGMTLCLARDWDVSFGHLFSNAM